MPSRTQSSLAVSTTPGRWVLFNASPDLRQQIAATPCLQPPPESTVAAAADAPAAGSGLRRASPIAAVVLTNADVDHVAGLLSLRESQPFALVATARVQAVLAANPVFSVLNPRFVVRQSVDLEVETELQAPDGRSTGLIVRLFAVPGKVALYLENPAAGADFGSVAEDTVGVEVRSVRDGARFFYVPGCSRLTADLARRLDGAPLLLFDGTVWNDDEMAATGVGEKTGQRMGHIAMAGPDGSLAAFAGLSIGRKLFIHINNTNPVLAADAAERRIATAAGWEIAMDGQELRL